MGQRFFGVDIQQQVADAFRGNVATGTLTKRAPGSRTPGDLTAGTNPSETSYTFDGFLEVKRVRAEGEVNASERSVLTIIAGSLEGGTIAPAAGDRATIDGLTVTVSEILERDPATAVYECLVE